MLATTGLSCLELSDDKSSPLWQKSKRQVGDQSHPEMFEKQKYVEKQEACSAPGQGPGSIVVLCLVSACSACMAFTGMKQSQLEITG